MQISHKNQLRKLSSESDERFVRSTEGGRQCLACFNTQLAHFLMEALKASVVTWKEFWFTEKKKKHQHFLLFASINGQIKRKFERALLSLKSAISDFIFGRNQVLLQNICSKLNLSSFFTNKWEQIGDFNRKTFCQQDEFSKRSFTELCWKFNSLCKVWIWIHKFTSCPRKWLGLLPGSGDTSPNRRG